MALVQLLAHGAQSARGLQHNQGSSTAKHRQTSQFALASGKDVDVPADALGAGAPRTVRVVGTPAATSDANTLGAARSWNVSMPTEPASPGRMMKFDAEPGDAADLQAVSSSSPVIAVVSRHTASRGHVKTLNAEPGDAADLQAPSMSSPMTVAVPQAHSLNHCCCA